MPDEFINCFDPIVDSNTKIIILGTLPGIESIISGEYYKNPRNCFWRIMYELFDETITNDYAEKCSFLLRHEIGVWDVLDCATREGNDDLNIANPVVNNFTDFFKQYPGIKGMIFNGRKAEKIFKRYLPDLFSEVRHETVLSSSGALARPCDVKLANWKNSITLILEG